MLTIQLPLFKGCVTLDTIENCIISLQLHLTHTYRKFGKNKKCTLGFSSMCSHLHSVSQIKKWQAERWSSLNNQYCLLHELKKCRSSSFMAWTYMQGRMDGDKAVRHLGIHGKRDFKGRWEKEGKSRKKIKIMYYCLCS